MTLLVAVLVDDVFGHAVPRVLDVHLNDDGAVGVVIAQEGIDPAVEFGGLLDPALGDDRILVDAYHVLACNGDAHEGCARDKDSQYLAATNVDPGALCHDGDAAPLSCP